MKPGILLIGRGNSDWVGGLYYIKNIAFVLMQNNYIVKNYNLFLLVDPENRDVFDGLNEIKIITMPPKAKRIEKFYRIYLCKIHNIKYMFPCSSKITNFLKIKGISWIPDFQHNRLTEMYTEEEIAKRTNESKKIIENGNPLVLSSYDCKNDVKNFYGREENVAVVPFVSYIEHDLLLINPKVEKKILEKYHLLNAKYIYVANQFWKHKNHIVVFEAAKKLARDNKDIKIVFTGKLRDPRNPEYIKNLAKYFEDDELSSILLNLGFIDREEQIVIMKNANFVIQPSLFEGWGTVVEDAKVLNKDILLSDIPVHREQKNEKCVFFDPYDSEKLAILIDNENQKEHRDDIDRGIKDMYSRANDYSKGFEKLLRDLENK